MIRIFYSWQSDIDRTLTKNAFRRAIENAKEKLESDDEELSLYIDEATRDLSGSPEIPTAILSKIYNCDIFICDLTIINQNQPNRKVPNPNVMYELGFALSIIGWDRIIMLMNTHFGQISDLPFDLEKRRVSAVQFNNRNDGQQRSKIEVVVYEAIKSIITNSPPRRNPFSSLESPGRLNDEKFINEFMDVITPDDMDFFFEKAPQILSYDLLGKSDRIRSMKNSSNYYIHDQTLQNLFEDFENHLNTYLSHGDCYTSGGLSTVRFTYTDFRGETIPENYKILYELGNQTEIVFNKYKSLLRYIKQHFIF